MGVLSVAMGGGNVLGLDALEALLDVVQGEGTGATDVSSRIRRVLGGRAGFVGG